MSPASVAAGKKSRNGSLHRSLKVIQRPTTGGVEKARRCARRGHCAGAAPLIAGLIVELIGENGGESYLPAAAEIRFTVSSMF